MIGHRTLVTLVLLASVQGQGITEDLDSIIRNIFDPSTTAFTTTSTQATMVERRPPALGSNDYISSLIEKLFKPTTFPTAATSTDLEFLINEVFGSATPATASSTEPPPVSVSSSESEEVSHSEFEIHSLIEELFKPTTSTTAATSTDLNFLINEVFGSTTPAPATITKPSPALVSSSTRTEVNNSVFDLNAILKEVYAIDNVERLVSSQETPVSIVTSTPVPEVATTATMVRGNATDNSTCITENGEVGKCVPYFLCMNNTITTDGTGVIDIRTMAYRKIRSVPADGEMEDVHEPSASKRRRRQADATSDVEEPCSSFTHICCLLPNKTRSEQTSNPKPDPEPFGRVGCGWRNPDGIGDGKGLLMTRHRWHAKFGEFPWMMAILHLLPVEEGNPQKGKLIIFIGGGSLIHPSVVLTGANTVVSNLELFVRAGEWEAMAEIEPYPYQMRRVESVVAHKDYNKANQFYNIALLFLEKPVTMAPNVGVVCLPPARYRTPAGTRCFVTGWGKNTFGKGGRYQSDLLKIDVPVVDRGTCESRLRGTRLSSYYELHESFMCAGGERGMDACLGDGGSPLSCPMGFQLDKDRYMQSGIVSWGIGCGKEGVPGVYVDVAHLRDWIDDQVTKKGYDPRSYEPWT